MKKISKLMGTISLYKIFIFLIITITNTNIIAQNPASNRWFVNKNASGSNNGTSWENAWTSFSNINWNLIQPGSTVYISGGNDSTVYNETLTLGKSGNINGFITVTKGLSAGHNGRVIIDGGNGTRTHGVDIQGYDYLKIAKLEIRRSQRGVTVTAGANVILLDSLVITDYFDQAGIKVNGWTSNNSYSIDSVIIRNCYISNSDYNAQNDNSYFLCVDNLIIDGCTFINNNVTYSSTDDYSDNIQTQNVGNAIIRNNVLINNAGFGDQGIIGNFTNNALTNEISTVNIYNNIIIFPNAAPSSGRCIITRYYDWYISSGLPQINIFSNSLYGALNVTGVALQLPASVRNNIIYTIDEYCIVQDNQATGDTVNNVFNNLMYKSNGGTFIGGTWTGVNGSVVSNPSYETWINTLGGSPMITSNPLFNNLSSFDFELQSQSPAIDAGAILGAPYNVDILGVSRPQGAGYDIGAYEYFTGSIVDITPPQLINAEILDSITLDLEFSEVMEEQTSENIENYTVNNEITVLNATLLTAGNKVRLVTSTHSNNLYQVTVNNVTDVAGNIISAQQNSFIYEYQSGSSNNMVLLPVSDVLASVTPEPDHYAEKTLDGFGFYDGDPDSRWAGDTMPEWLVYDLGDVQILNKTQLSFFNWNEGRIYNYTLQVSVDSISWNEIRTNVPSVAAEWSIEVVSPVEARYVKIIFIANNQSAWAGLWEAEFYGHLKLPTNYEEEDLAPVQFTLEQNYPNPFNPATSIRYAIPSNQFVQLKVYDVIGNEIATLVNEYRPAGKYEVEFNAENFASGIYIYRIQTEAFTETKKMVLVR